MDDLSSASTSGLGMDSDKGHDMSILFKRDLLCGIRSAKLSTSASEALGMIGMGGILLQYLPKI